MIFHEAGSHRLRFVYDDSYPKISSLERTEIAHYWDRKWRANNLLEDKPHVCAHSYKESEGIVTIGWNTEGYAAYSYFREHQIARPGTYSMGAGTIIYLRGSEEYVFVERSGNVQWDQGKISISSGGTVDAPTLPFEGDLLKFIHSEADRETKEELITRGLGPSVLLGYYVVPSTLKIEFLYFAAAEEVELSPDNHENKRAVMVPRGQVADFALKANDNLEASTSHLLSYWSQYLDQLNNY